MTAYEVLVIVLSIALAILLVFSIALVIATIKLVKYLQQISAKASAVMEDVEAVGDFFRKSAGPMALARLLGTVLENFGHHKRKDKS